MKPPAAARDVGLALGVVTLGEIELFSGERYNGGPVWPGPVWLAAILIVVFAGPLVFRRSHPEIAVVCIFGLLSVYGLSAGAPEAATGFVLLIVTTFSGAAYARRLWVVLVSAGVFCVVFFFDDASAKGITDKTWVFGLGAVAVLLGRAVHARQLRIGRLESDVTTQLVRHAAEVEVAVAAERGVIARELHDIVSHAVSVIVIQAQVGNRALPSRPADATRALDAIEESARTAMVELRRLLTVLGPDTDAEAIRPTASLSQLDDLLNGWRTAGMDVELAAEELPALPPAVDLAAYRIVQESLTNTARHAPGARAVIRIHMDAGHLEVTTQDSGPHARSKANGSTPGRGIIGMRQRVELVGGELLSAGPSPQGFLVHARLPVLNVPA
jgi:signal transduction histidine kinase